MKIRMKIKSKRLKFQVREEAPVKILILLVSQTKKEE